MQIFVADVTDDYRLSRKRLIKQLEERNATVHYRLPPPFKMDLHDSLFNTTVSNCDVCVHILSQYPGRTFDDPEDVYISLHQANAGLSGSTYKVFWIPKSLDLGKVDEVTYRDFLRTLDFGFDDHTLVLVKGDPQTLHEDIVKAIPFPRDVVKQEGTLIVHHDKDVEQAIHVKEQARNRNIQTQYNSSGDNSPSANLKLLSDQLRDVRNVVMIVGSVNNEWANERAKHILSTLIQMEYTLDSIGFYFGEGSTPFPFDGRFLQVRKMVETDGQQESDTWNTFLIPNE